MSSVYISHVGSHSLRTTSVGGYRRLEVERSILMFVEMTPGSNQTISRKGLERNFCIAHKQQTPRSDKICHFSGSRTKNQKQTKAPCLRNCLKFRFKDRTSMEQREQHADSLAEGRLRELASKWFIETQLPLVVQNGFFPAWFMGFISRKDAEEILREKELGCFLIRLSDKAIGYILSYRGRDRCRHFVINQSESGQFVVTGDTEGHNTVPDLIEYYKTRPIEPFGEYLTSSCFEGLNEELYDIIQVRHEEKPVASVRAVRNVQKQQSSSASEQQPTRPPKTNRTLQEVPPLPRRSRHLESAPVNDQDNVLYAQLMKQPPREIPRAQHISQDNLTVRSTTQDQIIGRCSPPSRPAVTVYSELGLLDYKSRSLPLLDHSSDGEHSHRLSAPPCTPPRLSPKPNRQAKSYGPTAETTDACSRSLDYVSESAVYHLAGRPHTTSTETRSLTPEMHSDSVYAEVTAEALVSRLPHNNTYELIPGHKDTTDTYEPLEDIRPKHQHSCWGLKNDKWKWLFPDAKKKW
ncbi:LOW QUALITY PROTEIN: SH2 domain-containing protein 7-like [Thunnus albacares]|uniref:LOW QUALITY PROTEIN: SH2 domain-containing protein 7-like n=1 Tax=Thunnus albacares TaxID=8236 RepID=UPI001CF6115A|nr:LOW QUALITY PROTEIN: SH2 domain-containing protein 7-like [Thunnus albacares]